MDRAISLTERDELGLASEFLASETDYDDVTLYSLVCPDCYTKVTLVKEHAGVSKLGKLYVRDSYFCHHKMSKWSLDCEKRAKTPSRNSYDKLRQRFPRGQTLTKFNRHLWRMICEDNPIGLNSPSKLAKDLQDQGTDTMLIVRSVREYIDENLTEVLENLGNLVDFFYEIEKKKSEHLEKARKEGAVSEVQRIIDYIKNSNKLFHYSICCEVLQFVINETGSELLFNLCFGGLCGAIRMEKLRGVDLKTSEWSIHDFTMHVLVLITDTYWCTALEKAEKLYNSGRLDRLYTRPKGFGQRNKRKKVIG